MISVHGNSHRTLPEVQLKTQSPGETVRKRAQIGEGEFGPRRKLEKNEERDLELLFRHNYPV
jgi:hypothetical protein